MGPAGVVHYAYAMGISGTDPGNIMYVRSTDNGTTWSAPLQLNTDATTRAQWMPSVAVTTQGAVLVTWYDERETASCGVAGREHAVLPALGARVAGRRRDLAGGPARWVTRSARCPTSRTAQSSRSTWATTTMPARTGNTGYTCWVDGRTLVSGNSQQDVYCDKVSLTIGTPTPTVTGTLSPTPTRTNTATATRTPTPTLTPTCSPAGSYHVLLVYADGAIVPANLRTAILAETGVVAVDTFDGQAGTPTLAQLQQYEIVVPFSNFGYADPVALGNNLADYLDGGGVVVAFNFSWYGGAQSIQGRWLTGNYTPYNNPGSGNFSNGTLGTCTFAQLCTGVTTLNAFYRETMTLAAGATLAATWNDATPLIAYKGRAIGVSAYVGDYAGQWSGDFGRVIVNAGRWLRPQSCGTATATTTGTPPTNTPSPTPTATACGGPLAWTVRSPFPNDVYGSFSASDGTYAYMGGGYSFSSAGNINTFARFNPTTNVWTTLTNVPDMNNSMATAAYSPVTNKIYVFGGELVSPATVVRTLRIYDIGTNTWTTGANMPAVRAFMGGGFYNNKVYLIGGYDTGNVSPVVHADLGVRRHVEHVLDQDLGAGA